MHLVGARIGDWVVMDVVVLTEPWVYKAHHHEDPAQLASLQVARRGKHDDRIRREAAVLRKFDHPAIGKLLGHGETSDVAWIATAWAEGEALSDRLLQGALEWRDACVLFAELASALAYVHSTSFVHRDITPAHVRLLQDGSARLEGFGLAMEDAELDRTANLGLGDLSYVAPEALVQPDHHAPRADLYALGCVFYEALTGRPAFPAAAWGGNVDPASRMVEWKTRAEALDPGSAVPAWLAQLVKKATHPDPGKRLPDMEAFVGWLDGARPSWAPAAPVTPPPPPTVSVPALAPIVLAPMLQVAPSFASPIVPSDELPPSAIPTMPLDPTTPRSSMTPWPADSRRGSGAPPSLRYAQAAVLGVVAGLAFSGLVIAFVEFSGRS